MYTYIIYISREKKKRKLKHSNFIRNPVNLNYPRDNVFNKEKFKKHKKKQETNNSKCKCKKKRKK